ncbi:MAG TPA: hypothetical protein VNA24_12650 [Hyalangium sp.]|nr:hypothetical protein [Hyalangium sp.]
MSILPESSPSPVLAPEQEAPQLAALDPAESEYQAARKLFLTSEPARQSWIVLLGTMVLFALAARLGEQGWRGVVVLVGVLLFHELGHWLGMKIFSFQDVRMFFIPFFGAAVSGRNVSAAAWKEALVLLMGPLPGLLVGTILLWRSSVLPSHLVANVGMMFLLINAFNLLPLSPLDGGRFFQLLIFSRNRFLELAFTVFAGLGLVGLALLVESWMLGVVAGMVLLSLPRQSKLLRTVKELRASQLEVDREPEKLDEPSLRALYASSGTLVPQQLNGDQRLQQHVRAMRQVHERTRMYPPSVLASLGLGIIWGIGLVVMFVGLLGMVGGWTPTAPQWAQYQDAQAGFTVLMPVALPGRSDVDYGVAPDSRVDGETLHAVLWKDHKYSVSSWKLETPPATDAERERVLGEIQAALVAQVRPERTPAALDAPRELAGIAGRHLVFSGAAEAGPATVREEYWYGLREGRAYVLRAEYDSRLASSEEAERFFTSFRPGI